MVPKRMKESYTDSKKKYNHENSQISRTHLGQRNCHRHNTEVYTQSNPSIESRNYPSLPFHPTYGLESTKMNSTSRSDKFSNVLASSPTEEHFSGHHVSGSKTLLQSQKASAPEAYSYRECEPKQSSNVYKNHNEISTRPCPYPSYTSRQYADELNQSRRPKQFHPLSKHKDTQAVDFMYTEPSLTSDLMQHATGNRVQQPFHSSSLERIRNQELNLEQSIESSQNVTKTSGCSPNRNSLHKNKSNRSSTGSNIIPPPHDFESELEQEEILRIESDLKVDVSYNPNQIETPLCADHNVTSNSNDKETRSEGKIMPTTGYDYIDFDSSL